jgi:hypothetical protein
MLYTAGEAVEQLFEALLYKPEGRGFESWLCTWIFYSYNSTEPVAKNYTRNFYGT